MYVKVESKAIEKWLEQLNEEEKGKVIETALQMFIAVQQKLNFDLCQADIRLLVRPRVQVIET